jgi:hypothetical protein
MEMIIAAAGTLVLALSWGLQLLCTVAAERAPVQRRALPPARALRRRRRPRR